MVELREAVMKMMTSMTLIMIMMKRRSRKEQLCILNIARIQGKL